MRRHRRKSDNVEDGERNYVEAIFNTASNGDVVITSDGSGFVLTYGGASRLSGEVELATLPGRPLLTGAPRMFAGPAVEPKAIDPTASRRAKQPTFTAAPPSRFR